MFADERREWRWLLEPRHLRRGEVGGKMLAPGQRFVMSPTGLANCSTRANFWRLQQPIEILT